MYIATDVTTEDELISDDTTVDKRELNVLSHLRENAATDSRTILPLFWSGVLTKRGWRFGMWMVWMKLNPTGRMVAGSFLGLRPPVRP
jgi:hypothetical protein